MSDPKSFPIALYDGRSKCLYKSNLSDTVCPSQRMALAFLVRLASEPLMGGLQAAD